MHQAEKNTQTKTQESSERTLKIGPNVTCREHEFTYVSGNEIECMKCPVGFITSPGTTVKDGHVYIYETLVI